MLVRTPPEYGPFANEGVYTEDLIGNSTGPLFSCLQGSQAEISKN